MRLLSTIFLITLTLTGCKEVTLSVVFQTESDFAQITQTIGDRTYFLTVELPEPATQPELVKLKVRPLYDSENNFFSFRVDTSEDSRYLVYSEKRVSQDITHVTLAYWPEKFPRLRFNREFINARMSPAVGLLKINHTDQCHGTLVSTTQVLTTWHCIQDEKTCAQSEFMIDVDSKAYSAKCAGILFKNEPADQTLIELDTHNIPQIEIPEIEDEKVFLPKGTPLLLNTYSSNARVAKIYKVGDSRYFESMRLNGSDFIHLVLFHTYDLQMPTARPGQSGSPLFSPDGKLLGMISGSTGLKTLVVLVDSNIAKISRR